MKRQLAIFLTFIFVLSFTNVVSAQTTTIFDCKFKFYNFHIKIDDADLSARLGPLSNGANYGQAYFDSLHKAWIVVGFISGGLLPSNLTTILPNGDAFHSRQTLSSADTVYARDGEGICKKL